MEYIIITNNSKVYNFYKETNEVLFYQKKDLIDLLEIIREKIYAGHILLSDPILSTLDNLDNPYKSVAISKADFLGEILIRDDSQKKMIDHVTFLSFHLKKLRISQRKNKKRKKKKSDTEEAELEKYRFIDLNILTEFIKRLDNF